MDLLTDHGSWGVASGKDGNLWVTDSRTSQIARITPDGEVTEFGGLMGQPRGITRGPDECLWFVEAGGSGISGGGNPAIGEISPDGQILEHTAGLSSDAEPVDIALGADGHLWFTERSPARIGRITKEGVITEFTAGLTPGSEPTSITAGPDGNMWFTEAGGNGAIGRITPAGEITEHSTGLSAGREPWRLTSGPDGNVWFTQHAFPGRLGRITIHPGVLAKDASELGADHALLNGKVLPNAQSTVSHFEYGRSSKYSEQTERASLAADRGHRYVSAEIGGLEPDTKYHFRLVATNDSGTTVGPNRTFITASLLPPTEEKPKEVVEDRKAVEQPVAPKPELGESVVVAPAAGVVRVKVPGRSDYVELGDGAEIPVGALVDTRRGRVTLTSALKADGERQTGTFRGGVFSVRQRRGGRVDLHLRGGSFR
ncbi:MAG: virginiamycin B lyase family protein, partial [Thermoleophilaceae bacterium]